MKCYYCVCLEAVIFTGGIMTAKLEAFYENYKKKKFSYLISYTVSFIFVALFFFRYFVIYNKTFVDTGDGIVQHYNVLLYYSKLLHKIWNTLLSEHRLIVPMWDFSIGFGEDITDITALIFLS